MWSKILTFVLPYALKAAEKCLPAVINNLFNKRRNNKMIKVTATNGSSAIVGATIVLSLPSGVVATQTTDANGQTTFSGLVANAAYIVKFSATGYEDKNTTVQAPADDATVSNVTITASAKSAKDIISDASAAVSGAGTTGTDTSDIISEIENTTSAAIKAKEAALTAEISDKTKSNFVKARDQWEVFALKIADAGVDDATVALSVRIISAINKLIEKTK
ncbi:carboxypeptidase regulatory-like domain-containing protein [Pectinatus frisingensis]|uniref:carboxypeptidase regulatory-like domain-containing protein n=1 Tax=Pectinatus frisingensis TaxID=865 RepID=UPI003D808F23